MNRKALRALLPSLALGIVLPLVWAGPAEAIIGHPPVAADDHFDAQPGEELFVPAPGVLDNDYDIDGGKFTIGTVSAATTGALTMKTDGSFYYTPKVGFVGDATFTYRAIDTTGLQSATVTVTITVAAPDQPPVSAPDAYQTTSGVPLVVQAASGMLANDVDPEGHAVGVLDLDGPGKGELDLNGHWDGRFTYTPPPGYVGSDSFHYRAVDLITGTATGWTMVTITVVAPNHLPVGLGDAYGTPTDVPLVVAASSGLLANDTDPDGTLLSVFDLAQPAHGTVTNGGQWDGSFTYTPDAGYAGPDTFEYRATDGQADGLTGWIAVDITVAAPVAVPVDLVVGDLPASVGGKTVPVTAHVTSSNGTAAGVPVTLSLGGKLFTATTGQNGDAVVPVTLPAKAGRYDLTGQAGNVETSRPITVGTVVTGKIAAIRKLHRGQVLVVRGQVGTATGHVVVTLTGPGVKRTYERSTSATGKLALRLPAKLTSRPGRYRVTVTYVADAQHFATAPWTRAFRSVR